MAPGIVGTSIPADTPHAVSVSLPTWKANIGYEEGQEWVISKMQTGYPRFFIHASIQKLAQSILSKFGAPGEDAMLFPSTAVAERCWEFTKSRTETTQTPSTRLIELVHNRSNSPTEIWSDLTAMLFPASETPIAKQFWQHTGDGISSRRAEFCQSAFDDGQLVLKGTRAADIVPNPRASRGPKRYSRLEHKPAAATTAAATVTQPQKPESSDCSRFVEERFGRNLDVAFVTSAKLAICRRIAGTLKSNVGPRDALELSSEGGRLDEGFSADDVYLHPTGMSAIYNTHRLLMAVRGAKKSVCYGFPYIDTLKMLQKFGPGCHFLGHGTTSELDDLEATLAASSGPDSDILALFCEFPSNPLLKAPDMQRIRAMADKYDFAVVVDETVGNFLNVHVLPYADVVVSSLTKVFSGDSNVMGGSSVLNPQGRYYTALKHKLDAAPDDNYWGEDALFLERNSRDFVSRIARINKNAETLAELLLQHPRVAQVYYPKHSPTRAHYDICRCPTGGYGGLLSVTFHTTAEAIDFYDALETAKGPSLGTNFTLCSPYTLLAHYGELDWAEEYGVRRDLVRVSVGLEETEELVRLFERALAVLG